MPLSGHSVRHLPENVSPDLHRLYWEPIRDFFIMFLHVCSTEAGTLPDIVAFMLQHCAKPEICHNYTA